MFQQPGNHRRRKTKTKIRKKFQEKKITKVQDFKKPKLKVVKNDAPKKKAAVVNQEEIDAILDKISKSGYEQLTAKEKQTLFDASKN